MNGLGFDPRYYCERLAKAMPARFYVSFPIVKTLYPDEPQTWILLNTPGGGVMDAVLGDSTPRVWAAFFVPIADECGIRPSDLVAYEGGSRSLLESIIAAVVEWFEARP